MDQKVKKKKSKTERVTGLGRRTREKIGKWNQMTALRFQPGGGGETSDILDLPSGIAVETTSFNKGHEYCMLMSPEEQDLRVSELVL